VLVFLGFSVEWASVLFPAWEEVVRSGWAEEAKGMKNPKYARKMTGPSLCIH